MILNKTLNYFSNYSDLIQIHYDVCESKYKDKWVELTLTHSMIVSEISEQFISKLNVLGVNIDSDFVKRAILLHDIGVYKCFDSEFNNILEMPKYICHGQIGHDIIKDKTADLKLARVALTHTGFGGISVEEIEALSLPIRKEDMIQTTLEEELVAWSDKFHTKWPRFYEVNEVEEMAKKFGETKLGIFNYYMMKFGVPETNKLEITYHDWHIEFDKFVDSISN